MAEIRDIYGIGAKKTTELRRHYNIRTVRALQNYVRKIPDIITEHKRTGLKYHDRISKKIKIAEAKKHVLFIKKNIPGAIVAGSYRREQKKIGDIDILVISDLARVVNKLIQKKYIVATLVLGDIHFSGIARLPGTNSYRRVDIIKTTKEEKPFALLYFTGDFVQNITMRQKAKKMKYTLSQHGLKHITTGKRILSIKNERDIFKFLKLSYVEPGTRSHNGREKETLLKLT